MSRYEYGYTRDLDATLKAIGMTIEEINDNDNLKNGLKLALERYGRENGEEEEI